MKLLIFLIISISLSANIKNQMLGLYKNSDFQRACDLGYSYFDANKNNEEFISIYAFSCLNADHIDRLAIPIISLRFSKEARANASYFSIILMQKKLLYHALLDNYDVSIYALPTTEHILSKVFDLYAKLGPHQPQDFYLFEDESDNNLIYKLYISKEERTPKMVIETFYNDKALKRHIYW